jgi:hypothetical protein
MATFLHLQTIENQKGKLTVFEKLLPGGIKRVFYVYDNQDPIKGKHQISTHALTCVSGSCKVLVNDGTNKEVFLLDSPEKCLILNPEEWREIYDFEQKTILLFMSNQNDDFDILIKELV